jgi:hypothetical protein
VRTAPAPWEFDHLWRVVRPTSIAPTLSTVSCYPLSASICRPAGLATVVGFLLSVTFACGLFIAVAHVLNRRFIAPVYDVVANLTAFGCAVAASALLDHTIPAILSAVAIVCWLLLARRTVLDLRRRRSESEDETSATS